MSGSENEAEKYIFKNCGIFCIAKKHLIPDLAPSTLMTRLMAWKGLMTVTGVQELN